MEAAAAVMSADRQGEFTALLERHRKIVFKVAATYAWHPEDRAELVQEIATQLWRGFSGYDPARSFSTWMYRIALNVAISQLRSSGPRERQQVALDERQHDSADDAAADPEMDLGVRALNQVIAALDPLNRALLLLYLEERSSREIGEILGLSETNVTTRLSRLKRRIRNELT